MVTEYPGAPPGGPPPRDAGFAAAAAAVGSGDLTAAAVFLDQESAGGDADTDRGVGSVFDYGGDGSLDVAGEQGGVAPPSSSAVVPDALQAADGLFKENGLGVASEGGLVNVGMDAAAGAREVFDRPVQSSASTPLSDGRPQIV